MGKLSLEKMGAEFVHADLTELVSSQAKVMLSLGSTRCGTAPALPRPRGTQQAFDLANVRATRRLGERMGGRPRTSYSYLLSSLYFDTTITVISKRFPVRIGLYNEFARKAAGEEVINLLAQANPQTRLRCYVRKASVWPAHDKSIYPTSGAYDATITVASYYRTGAKRAGRYDLL